MRGSAGSVFIKNYEQNSYERSGPLVPSMQKKVFESHVNKINRQMFGGLSRRHILLIFKAIRHNILVTQKGPILTIN